LLVVANASAQTLRVTSWSLQPVGVGTNAAAAHTNGIRIPAAANALKRLDPDVILLQQVTDWAMCQELAEALKPAKYNVVTCSAFRDGRAAARRQQAAILAKAAVKPYFSWSETWRKPGVATAPGGFAFTAFHIDGRRVGLFSVQVDAGAANSPGKKQRASPTKQNPVDAQERLAGTVERLLAQVGAVSRWVTNRVEAIIVGGTFGLPPGQNTALEDEPLQLLHDAGFGDAFAGVPTEERGTLRGKAGPVADYIFTLPEACTTGPTVTHVRVSRRFPMTCDVQLKLLTAALTPLKAPKSRLVAARLKKGQPDTAPVNTSADPPQAAESVPAITDTTDWPAESPAPRQPSRLSPQLLWITSAGVGLPGLAATIWLLARRKRPRLPRTPPLVTDGSDASSGYTVVMSTRSATESPSHTPGPVPIPSPVIHIESPADTHTQTEALRQRALDAERQAERARALIREGLIPDLRTWLKQKLARKLISDRTQLLETQQAATRQAAAVEQRLARIERQVQEQNRMYVQRIEELTRELLVAKEENRELIRARIEQVKAEMAAARERLLAQE